VFTSFLGIFARNKRYADFLIIGRHGAFLFSSSFFSVLNLLNMEREFHKLSFDNGHLLCNRVGGELWYSPTLVFLPVFILIQKKTRNQVQQISLIIKSLFNLRCTYFELGNLLKAINFITSIFALGLYEGSRKTFNH